jgi:general secretion pathway protein L
MTSALQATVEASRRLFSWWKEELTELVPSPLRRWAAGEARRTIFAPENGQFVHYEEVRGRLVRRGETSLPAGGPGRRRFAARRLSRPIGVRLPRSACLIRQMELPAAARQDFGKILQLDLERATPFRHQDVYRDHFIENGPVRDGKLPVRQVVVKRAVLDPILQQLKSHNIEVDFADCWDDGDKRGLPINLLRGGQGEPASAARRRSMPALALGLCMLILAGSAVLLGLSKYETALQRLESETASAQAKAVAVNRSLTTAEASLTAVAELRRLKASRPPVIRILDELTRLLPDTAWVSFLKIEGDALEVTIVAQSTAELLPLFARSPLFATAALSSPVTYDSGGQSERATVRMTLKGVATPARPPDDREGRG